MEENIKKQENPKRGRKPKPKPLRRADSKYKMNLVKKYIVELLKEEGKWTNMLTYQVELVASNIVLWRQIREEVTKPDFKYLVPGSKGQETKNPLLDTFNSLGSQIRADLEKLTMNIKDNKDGNSGEDGFAAFMEEMNKI